MKNNFENISQFWAMDNDFRATKIRTMTAFKTLFFMASKANFSGEVGLLVSTKH